MNKLLLLATLLLLNMLWSSKASALCSVNNSSLAFGSFNTLTGSTVDSTGTITVTCLLQLSAYTIALSPGGSGTYSPRRMASGGNTLDYNLYTDAGYSQIWGNGTGGSFHGSRLGSPRLQKPYCLWPHTALDSAGCHGGQLQRQHHRDNNLWAFVTYL